MLRSKSPTIYILIRLNHKVITQDHSQNSKAVRAQQSLGIIILSSDQFSALKEYFMLHGSQLTYCPHLTKFKKRLQQAQYQDYQIDQGGDRIIDLLNILRLSRYNHISNPALLLSLSLKLKLLFIIIDIIAHSSKYDQEQTQNLLIQSILDETTNFFAQNQSLQKYIQYSKYCGQLSRISLFLSTCLIKITLSVIIDILQMNFNTLLRRLRTPILPVINIHGLITPEMTQHVEYSLRNVNPHISNALAVSINSRGGSPVQSEIIINKLKRFAKEHHLKIWMFAEDICASGGYYILAAGDKIYADRTSIIGSIGVVTSRFNLKGIVDVLEIQRRNIASNQNSLIKFTDPFIDPTEQAKSNLLEMSSSIHQDFIKHIQKYRGNYIKIKIDQRHKILYNGEIWNGEQALELGLIDQVGSMMQILSENFPGCNIQTIQKSRKAEILEYLSL